jgi:hypothetical protein
MLAVVRNASMSESRPRQFVKRLGRGAHYQEPNSVHLRSFGEDASVAISLVGRGYEKSGFDLTSYQGVMKSTQYRPMVIPHDPDRRLAQSGQIGQC